MILFRWMSLYIINASCNVHFTSVHLNSGLKFLHPLPVIRSLNVLSLWWVCTQRRWRKRQRQRLTNQRRGDHSIGTKTSRWIALMKRRSSGCSRNLRNWTHGSPTARTECSCNKLSKCKKCVRTCRPPVTVWPETFSYSLYSMDYVSTDARVLHKWRIEFYVGLWGKLKILQRHVQSIHPVHVTDWVQPVELAFFQETLY